MLLLRWILVGMCDCEQGLNPGPLHWECGVLAFGPAGKYPEMFLLNKEINKVKADLPQNADIFLLIFCLFFKLQKFFWTCYMAYGIFVP